MMGAEISMDGTLKPKGAELHLRPVTGNDAEMLFEWVNDAEVRKNSFSTHQISYEEHMAWLEKLLSDDSSRQYILMDGDSPVGTIRVDVSGNEAEISYSISRDKRGMGYGKSILEMLPAQLKQDFPQVKVLIGQVKPANVASKKAFLKAGYTEKYDYFEAEVDEMKDYMKSVVTSENGGVWSRFIFIPKKQAKLLCIAL